ncbi:MAG: NAD-dependent epimerase/dehydratase family protein [Clostridia bacterium]|nr:NAD-dependent epimerase/dehydratase family protein [Clostridia bacterium]
MYIVVGANGFLGSYVVKSLVSNTDEEIIATYHGKKESLYSPRVNWVHLDVTDNESVRRLAEFAGNIEECRIFYFSACHNLDLVKRDPNLAKGINITALESFLEFFSDADGLWFSSTDCVYGENTAEIPLFKESDPTCPVSEYGRQKLEAEKIVNTYGFNAVRLPYMIGPSLLENKKHFYDNIVEKTADGQDFTLADGLWRSALDYQSVADILVKLSMMKNTPQVLNLCGDDSLSKYDVGIMIAEKHNLPTEHIIKTPEEEIMKLFDERRTSSTAMDNSLLKSVLGTDEIKIKF